jgi:hypothetical protein
MQEMKRSGLIAIKILVTKGNEFKGQEKGT